MYMTDFRGNIDNWIRRSDPDYYMHFLKAWIPFNAWYVAEMPQFNKKDSPIIKELQDNPRSKPRLCIESRLTHNDHESIMFKHHLGKLHLCLEKYSLIHQGKPLTFSNIDLSENHKKYATDTDALGNIYKSENKLQSFEAIIVNNQNKTILHYRNKEYDLEGLTKNIQYVGLRQQRIKNKISKCYSEIDPTKPTNLFTKARSKKDYILLCPEEQIKFINNPTIIAKACIKVLYSLRCMLFHGELDPTQTNMQVYKHSQFLLTMIIKSLI